jgi:hypothetical protein
VLSQTEPIEWISDQIVEIKSRKTLTLGKPVRMEEDNGADPFRPFPEHFKVRIGQIPAGYIR